MAIHELTTNAAKYGPLRDGKGRIEIDVTLYGNQKRVEWKERDGPPIEEPPKRRGFGTIMLENIVASDLNGTIDLHYEPDGLRCVLVFPEDDE